MCIIIACPAGVDIPDEDTLKALWDMNPDGAGYMYSECGSVEVRKGYMSFNALMSALDDFKRRHDSNGLDVCIHMRIATSGKVNAANCHPFPVDKPGKWYKRRVSCECAVAHNGIFDLFDGTADKRDTVEYVDGILSPLYSIAGKFGGRADEIVNSTRGKCRLAILDGDGLHLYGKWHEDGGVYYSNLGYQYAIQWEDDFPDFEWEDSPCDSCALCEYCSWGYPMCDSTDWECYEPVYDGEYAIETIDYAEVADMYAEEYAHTENKAIEVYEDNAGCMRLYIVDTDEWRPLAVWSYLPYDEDIERCASDYVALVCNHADPIADGWDMETPDTGELRRWYMEDSNQSTLIGNSDWEDDANVLHYDYVTAGASGRMFMRFVYGDTIIGDVD